MHELFADELKKLRGRFMEMGINVSEQIYASTKSFIDHDLKAANKVIEDDITTNKEEVSLEERALKLIALQQPVASDFRAIISILKASTDLERMGDYSVNIARETIRVKGNPRVNEIEKAIDEMTKLIREMLEEALDAYVRNDEKMARKVALRDLEADKQYILIRNNITAAMQQDSETVVANSGYMMVVRLLERMGDHIVNLSEWIVYNASGELVELNPGKKDPEMVRKLLNDKL